VQRGADCVEAAGGRRVIAKANTPSKSPSGVRHGLCPWWTTLSEFIIFSIQYSVLLFDGRSPYVMLTTIVVAHSQDSLTL
jgi:hypothetical protein